MLFRSEKLDEASACGFIVHFVIHVLFRIGDPSITSRGFEAKVVPHNSFPGCSRGNSFLKGRSAEAEFHKRLFLVQLIQKLKLCISIVQSKANFSDRILSS